MVAGSVVEAVAAAIAAAPPVRTIDDVIALMRRIDALLPATDGVKWFNFLYLRVTESVRDEPPAGGWSDPVWLERLDVVFANLYFSALAAGAACPRAWRALFDVRTRRDIARIQFALAGMNAHINHDLALALVSLGPIPAEGSPRHRDFERVNALLERVEGEVKQTLLTGLAAVADHHLGRLDDVIALWKVRKARETAWENAEILWELRSMPPVRRKFETNLDRLVALSSKGLLASVV